MSDDSLFFGPCLNPGGDDAPSAAFSKLWQAGWTARAQLVPPLSDQELAALREAFLRKAGGPVKLLTPLPRRVRLRLAVTRAVDEVAIWLCDHGRHGDAAALWWLTGGWC